MKHVGVTAYGINVRNQENKNLELHDIYGISLLEYLEGIAKNKVDKYDKDSVSENIFAYNKVNLEKIKNVSGQDGLW